MLLSNYWTSSCWHSACLIAKRKLQWGHFRQIICAWWGSNTSTKMHFVYGLALQVEEVYYQKYALLWPQNVCKIVDYLIGFFGTIGICHFTYIFSRARINVAQNYFSRKQQDTLFVHCYIYDVVLYFKVRYLLKRV